MKVIILGAGQVGASVAEGLVSEENDITVVDYDAARLAQLQDRLDLRTVVGNAATPSTLRDAGAHDADMIIAVMESDQSNLVACKLAYSVFNVPTRIARLRSRDFLEDEALLSAENFAVDFALCPEQVITDYIRHLIEFPEALQVLDFANGRVSLVAVRAYEGGLLVGKQIKQMRDYLPPEMDARIAAIFRRDQPVFPEGDTVVEAGDEVFLLAAAEHIRPVLCQLRRMMKPVERIMIAGGGNIGLRLAKTLEKRYEIKLIEGRKERAELIANELNNTLVLLGDATDEDLLEQENIAEMDLFIAVTNDDEDNIMSGSLAKRLGSKRVVALINRRAYAEMIEEVRSISVYPRLRYRLAHCWHMFARVMWPRSIRCGGALQKHWSWLPMATRRPHKSSASGLTKSTGHMALRLLPWFAISTRQWWLGRRMTGPRSPVTAKSSSLITIR
jgi:trk system potassium uptake protein TrkA